MPCALLRCSGIKQCMNSSADLMGAEGALEAYADLQDRHGAGYIWVPKPVNRVHCPSPVPPHTDEKLCQQELP